LSSYVEKNTPDRHNEKSQNTAPVSDETALTVVIKVRKEIDAVYGLIVSAVNAAAGPSWKPFV
jgi:hypothetical protein